MRYEGWDVMLFPFDDAGDAVPLHEFKVACQVVHDVEFAHSNGSFGLPTVTCFIPSLPAGSAFKVSIHSWTTPEISRYTKVFSKHHELVKIEARVLIDGHLTASGNFNRDCNWPQNIFHSFAFSKTGDLELLKFPRFRQEIRDQSYWHPADDMGRIKIIISEGFPRDSLTMPIERVKNIVAFSFQHAPLEVLESSSIAWPNASMWHRAPSQSNLPVPTYHPEDGSSSHAHSPRRPIKVPSNAAPPPSYVNPPSRGTGCVSSNLSNKKPFLQAHKGFDRTTRQTTRGVLPMSYNSGSEGFVDFSNGYSDWLAPLPSSRGGLSSKHGHGMYSRNARISSNSDTSMPDYSSSSHSTGQLSICDMLTGPSLAGEDFGSWAAQIRVPSNSPVLDNLDGTIETSHFSTLTHSSTLTAELESTLTESMLNQTAVLNSVPPRRLHIPSLMCEDLRVEASPLQASTSSGHPLTEAIGHTTNPDYSENRQTPMASGGSRTTVPSEAMVEKSSAMRSTLDNQKKAVTTSPKPSKAQANEDEVVVVRGSPARDISVSNTYVDVNIFEPKGIKRNRQAVSGTGASHVLEDEVEPRRPSPRARVASTIFQRIPTPLVGVVNDEEV